VKVFGPHQAGVRLGAVCGLVVAAVWLALTFAIPATESSGSDIGGAMVVFGSLLVLSVAAAATIDRVLERNGQVSKPRPLCPSSLLTNQERCVSAESTALRPLSWSR
jgi:hypothetical protein